MVRAKNPEIRILLVDDHPVVRAGLTSMLSTHDGLSVAGAANGERAIAMCRETHFDLMLLDLRMPGMTGIDTLHEVAGLKDPPRVIILTSYETDEDIYRAVQAGASGYLLKSTPQDDIIAAIRAVYEGRLHLPPRIASRLTERMERSDLTEREIEILELMAKGLTNKEIGQVLSISDKTARNHVNNLMAKLEVSDRTEAVAVAIRQGVIQIVD
jgi:DNA-binding NarL/FixJ family response regulator